MDINSDIVKKAYKKLKSSIYFDKTQLVLRDMIVSFESEHDNIDQYLDELWSCFENESKWCKLKEEILTSIEILSYPKKLKQDKQTVIMNSVSDNTKIEELQHLINLDVRGHIFGVVWLLMIGWRLDNKTYEHSYGNRIRKNLISELEDGATYSPYLFEPYFQQYESWRDTALTHAEKCLSRSQDVIILTMDFRRFYYSVDITSKAFENIINSIGIDEQENEAYKRINEFVLEVIQTYAKKFNNEYDGRSILPIGFLPSNILANWYLCNFDKAIINGWNPIYYGRYVDDILIIDKVEKNSEIYNKAQEKSLSRTEVIKFFLEQCSKWKGFIPECENSLNMALLQEDKELTKKAIIEEKKAKKFADEIHIYTINPIYNLTHEDKSKIVVHNDKVKIFYFKHGETDALLNCFRNNISNNKSEFRFMPEDEAVFQDDDYSEIYCLNESESIHKLRGVDGITIDKFSLSKFLGKFLRIGGLIDDTVESKFERDISKIFDARTIIENYTTWEKVIEIFVINNKFEALYEFVVKIIKSVNSIGYLELKIENNIKKSLMLTLRSALAKAFSVNWGYDCNDCLSKIYKAIGKEYNFDFTIEKMLNLRKEYCKTRMCDKYVLPVLIDVFLNNSTFDFTDIKKLNFTNFLQVTSIFKGEKVLFTDYKYYPYIITIYDISMCFTLENLMKKSSFNPIDQKIEEQKMTYLKCNFDIDFIETHNINKLVKMQELPGNDSNNKYTNYAIKVGDGKKDLIRFAVANAQVSQKNFELVVKESPDRSYKRYSTLSFIINQAIRENVDMLVMPESYVPFEWLPIITRTCAKNHLGIVTGVEHIKIKDKMYNLTAVILPYQDDEENSAHISFHLKKHYAPTEIQGIKGYRLEPIKGSGYELYCWNDCWFPVYCCYELSSITDRSLFQSYLDVLIAVEWNADTNYFSNILESLSRDLHCYCVQVNSSNYGDSRITKPCKTENKDIIRTKGGINCTILVDDIDIKALRDFQYKEFELQKIDGRFKVTPPDLDTSIVYKKMKQKLWDYLSNKEIE